jgi:predicted dehydrogenase/threonine dehydrogenase-like Zn-dependent dehydrogenase
MKQVTQRPRDGAIAVREAPEPVLHPGWVVVATRYSLISAGTERSKVELGEKNIVQKARARPDLVRKVTERARVEGVRATYAIVRDRLDALAPIGYSCSGNVIRVGTGVDGLAPGDAVACGGAGWANHAELVAVPRNLVAKVPDGVELADAAYATVGAIALHAVRQGRAEVGNAIGVVGLGLVGQLAVRILGAAGCRAIGIDTDPSAVAKATEGGALAFERDDPALEAAVLDATRGVGLDAVLVCAAASSPDPVQLAARLARDRGTVVVVGQVPVSAEWELLYRKELEIRLSRSYGPGRYDRDYEERGRDFPAAYVRWTERRNLEAFLALVAVGRVRPSELTTHRFPVDRAPEAYEAIKNPADTPRAYGVLLEYEQAPARPKAPRQVTPARRSERPRIGLIGAGAFARRAILPALQDASAELAAVASAGGLTAADVASRYGFQRAAESADDIFADDTIDAVVIATRHASHAGLTASALRHGKSVFVEKPLALSHEELATVEAAFADATRVLMVGFNRRYAPLTARLRAELATAPHRVLVARVNAGPLDDDHWMHDPEDGGGRLLAEGCHFVDLLTHLAGHPPILAFAAASPQPQRPIECSDSFVGDLRFADGSVGAVIYSGGGDTRLPKERIEAFGGGTAAVLDDFRRLEIYRNGRKQAVGGRQDKGHRAEIRAFLDAISGRAEPPDVESYLVSSRATLALVDSLRTGQPVEV